MNARWMLLTGAVFGLLSVVMGAFGSHALRGVLEETGRTEAWRIAVLYQSWNGVALLAFGIWSLLRPQLGLLRWVSLFIVAGIILFSGSLYILSVGGPDIFGPVTPIGGLSLVAGWALAIAAAVKTTPADSGTLP